VEVSLQKSGITGEVRGEDGRLLPAVVYVDSYRFEFPDGRIAVRAVPAGPHVVIVGARDHRGDVRRVVIERGEVRSASVVLPRR
jgi:hypothetical protein